MAQHWSDSTLEIYAKKEVSEHFNKENIVIVSICETKMKFL